MCIWYYMGLFSGLRGMARPCNKLLSDPGWLGSESIWVTLNGTGQRPPCGPIDHLHIHPECLSTHGRQINKNKAEPAVELQAGLSSVFCVWSFIQVIRLLLLRRGTTRHLQYWHFSQGWTVTEAAWINSCVQKCSTFLLQESPLVFLWTAAFHLPQLMIQLFCRWARPF